MGRTSREQQRPRNNRKNGQFFMSHDAYSVRRKFSCQAKSETRYGALFTDLDGYCLDVSEIGYGLTIEVDKI